MKKSILHPILYLFQIWVFLLCLCWVLIRAWPARFCSLVFSGPVTWFWFLLLTTRFPSYAQDPLLWFVPHFLSRSHQAQVQLPLGSPAMVFFTRFLLHWSSAPVIFPFPTGAVYVLTRGRNCFNSWARAVRSVALKRAGIFLPPEHWTDFWFSRSRPALVTHVICFHMRASA
jgi:hypothetical protein